MKWLLRKTKPEEKLLKLVSHWRLFETVDLNHPELTEKLRNLSQRIQQELPTLKQLITAKATSANEDDIDLLFQTLNKLPTPPLKVKLPKNNQDFRWEDVEVNLGIIGQVVNRIRLALLARVVSGYEKNIAELHRRGEKSDEIEQIKKMLNEEINEIDQEFRTHLITCLSLYEIYQYTLTALANSKSPILETILLRRLISAHPQERIIVLQILKERNFQPRNTEQVLNFYLTQAKFTPAENDKRQAEKELEKLISKTQKLEELTDLIEPRLAEEGLVHLQARALEKLAVIAPEQALKRYGEVFSHPDEPSELKIAAINAIAEELLPLNPESTVRLLLVAIDDLEMEVRVRAASALAKLPENTPSTIRDMALERLLFALRDGDLEVRIAAARALTPRIYPNAAEKLAHMLVTETNPYAREFAAFALGLNFDASPKTTEALIQALADDDAAVRKAAAEALVNQRAIPTEPKIRLLFFCARQDWGALIEAGSPAVECLLPRLRDQQVEIRLEVVKTLGKIRSRAAVQDLCIALSDASQDVRKAAARALAEIGDPAAIPALKTALTREGFNEVKRAMESALRKLS